MSRSQMPKLLSLIYVHNPFYLISTCLFVYGLKLLFRSGNTSVLFAPGSVAYMEPWGLMASLAGITVLMAVTAILIVRFGKVWEDARSLLLIVLFMLLAISVSFDELITLLSDRDNGRGHLYQMLVAGVLFSVGLAEFLIRGLPIRLTAGYRLPLYGFLTLFFLWPALLLRELTLFEVQTTRWLIAAFPLVAGLLTIALIPAIRKGAAAVANNGTPWNWPLFPWTPFVFIALAVCFRSYSLTMSFDAPLGSRHFWDTTFGLYQLVPFLLAIFLVLLEIGLVEKLPKLQRGVMLTAPLLIIPAYPWLVPWSRLPAYTSFTNSVVSDFASPVFLTIIGLTLLYARAWRKGVRYGQAGFYAMVFLAGSIGPRAFGSRIWYLQENVSYWPLLVLGVVQLIIAFRRRESLSAFIGMILLVCAANFSVRDFPDLNSWRAMITLHLAFAAMLIIGISFKDDFAEVFSDICPLFLSITMFCGIVSLISRDLGWLALGYAIGFTVFAFLLGRLLQNHGYLTVVAIHCGLGCIAGIVIGTVAFLRVHLVTGTKPVILAVVCFATAVLISMLKSGLSRRIRMWWLLRRRST
ncbi:MAG: hypothetical protein ABGZ53_05715 [Fuerstiella sp.]